MKSLPVPVAQVRSNLSEVLQDARGGKRIRVTRHGKPVGWIIGEAERERLDQAPARVKSPRSRRQRRQP